MLFRLGEIVLLPVAWAALVLGSLQSKLLVSASAHSVCGPWGCGPGTQALIAMHALWLGVIGPPLIYLPLRLKWQKAAIHRLSLGLILFGLANVLAIVAWQWLVWLPIAGPQSKNYIWQRCGFAIVTAVDIPVLQFLLLACVLWTIPLLKEHNARTRTFKNGSKIDNCDGSHRLYRPMGTIIFQTFAGTFCAAKAILIRVGAGWFRYLK